MEKHWIRKCRGVTYLDMGDTLFNKTIKPLLPSPFKVGDVSLLYERSDLDSAADECLRRSKQISKNHEAESLACSSSKDVKTAPTFRSIRRSKPEIGAYHIKAAFKDDR